MTEQLIKTYDNKGKKLSPVLNGLKNFIINIDGVICEDVPNESS